MATFNNITEYRNTMAKRASKLRKMQRRGPITAAKFMVTKCRQFAPKSTGNVLRSIKRNKNLVTVGGSRNGFPYIHWINATPGSGLETIRSNIPFVAVARNKSTAGFFWRAENATRRFFIKSMLRNTRSILRAKF